MRKYIFLAMGIWIAMLIAYSQNQSVTFPENFDGNNITFTSSPASAWKIDTNYYVSSRNSIRGVVPNKMGDSIVLTSPVYDFYTNGYSFVLLKFSHICKVSPMDIVRVEYRRKGTVWEPLPAATYQGEGLPYVSYLSNGFNANTYSEWRAGDSLALPSQSWWKEEVFDVSIEVGGDDEAQFRFVLKHGNTPGTQISYGWLIDNIEIIAAPYEIKMPVVEFVTPLIKDSVYSTGPWEINAKVKSTTIAQIENPWLKYTATYNGTPVANDSVLMTMVRGDSLWKANIPQFILGTEVVYSITGKDMTSNAATITSGYVIAKPNHNYGDTSVALTSIVSPVRGQTMGSVNMPVRVTIRNKGDSVLTSATIHWSVNGVNQQPYSWTGNLDWDLEQEDSLGIYLPHMEGYDTIRIWVSMPNGVQDIDLTDDTLTIITYGCAASMSGTYTVGQGGVFPDLKEALIVLGLCSPVGDITFTLKSGVYAENWDLANISNLMRNYSLTITSAAANADSVILRPVSGMGIQLANSNHLVIKNITVDAATSGTSAVQFIGACTNVLIRDCKLLANPVATATSYAPVYKENNTGIADSIFIINNLLDGGYYGFFFYEGVAYGTGQYGINIVFDSNTLSNQYYYGVYTQYVDFTSCSYNTIQSRTTNASSYWYGLSLLYTNGTVIGNRIVQRSNNIIYPYGISVQYFNYSNTIDTGLIANNEIRLNMTSAYPGIYANTYTKAKILHNSIYISGSGVARGIQIANNANNYMVIKNNNIVMESTDAYPIYLNSIANLALYDMDYNNMYAPNYVGYAGGNKTDIDAWQQTVTTDGNSINVRPSFIDSTVNLKVMNYSLLYTSMLPEVGRDIDGIYRLGALTAMGCYHEITPYAINASLGRISGLQSGSVFGQQDSIKVELFNTGTTALTSANLKWSVNGVTQSATGTWSGSLLPEQNTVITLGAINYTQLGDNIIRVWIDKLGNLQDEYPDDDTVRTSIYICQNALSGTYTVGNGGAFSSWSAAIDRVTLCGVGGDIVFEFLPNIYTTIFDLSDNSSLFGNHTLTITSSTRNAADVVFRTSEYGVLFSNSNHIIIDAVTIDAAQGTYAVQFSSNATHIIIRNCILLMDSVSTTSGRYAIYKNNGTGIASNISITHNIINGGSTGINFYGGTGTNLYGRHIVIDSNIIRNQYFYAMIIVYADSVSISNNRITSREKNTNSSWYGLSLDYINGTVTNNRILQQSNAINTPYGIVVSYFNYYLTRDTGMIANNEIILNSTSLGYGIRANNNTLSKILHNSIYISGTGTAEGILLYGDVNSSVVVKNNNIFMSSSQSYPVYLNLIDNLQGCDIDGNNMYALSYVAYAGDAISSIRQWQQLITTDQHSVSVNPAFIDNSVDLQLSNYRGLESYPLIEIPVDIEGNSRTGITAMGCYQGFDLYNTNAMLTNIQGTQSGFVLGTTDTIKAVLVNMGNTVLTNATFNWSFNDVTQSASNVTWSGNLSTGEKDTIILGVATYIPAGYYSIKVWIAALGSLQDQYSNDDTTQISGYICSSPWNGTISIGTTGTFKSIREALDKLYLCGVNGDITLALQQGIYNEEVDFRNISSLLGNYSLTLTSASGNAQNVTIKSKGNGIVLANSNNITIDAITIDITEGIYGIYFTNACTNIVIHNCRILADTTTSSQYGIYKPYNTGILDSIFIINNYIEGGYNGISFYGGIGTGAGQYGTHIVFDSNILSNQSQYGVFAGYVDFTSCSYNTILSRTENTYIYWYALYIGSSNGTIMSNRIMQRSTNITNPYGIYVLYYNYYNATRQGLIANNEIILCSSGSGLRYATGIETYYYSRADILHNSIYISGMGTAYGVSIYDVNPNRINIKHNNIAMDSHNAYAVYIQNGVIIFGQYDIDANNYYAANIGYARGNALASLSAWQSIINSDKNSVNIRPQFIDNTVHLQLSNYDSLRCTPLSLVGTDIMNNSRIGITAIGCYQGFNQTVNGMLTAKDDWQTGLLAGNTDTLKVELTNTAPTVLTNATIHWSFNGNTIQSASWSGSLARGQKADITLGAIAYIPGNNTFTAWIQNLGSLQDEYSVDDTIKLSAHACDSTMNGTYIIGSSGHYTTITQAIENIKTCGANGDIVLKIQTGIYAEVVDMTNLSLPLKGYNLTLTALSGNAEDVILQNNNTSVIILDNSNNIIISSLTVDAMTAMYGISFAGPTDNIVIRDCRIFSDSTTTSVTPTPVYKPNGSGTANNIRIINNAIYGGYQGIYFYGGSDTNTYSAQIVIDSNTIQSSYMYGAYAYYTDFESISHNTVIHSRNVSHFTGLYLSYINGNITSNRIFTGIYNVVHPKGIWATYHNVYNSDKAGLIANNEIRFATVSAPVLNTPTNNGFGLRTEYSYSCIVNNSINNSGAGVAGGIEVFNHDANKTLTIRNNIVKIEATAAVAYMLGGQMRGAIPPRAICLTPLPTLYDIDYNNLHALLLGMTATMGGGMATIAAWQQTIGTNQHSISIDPNFIDSSVSLTLNDFIPFLCPSYPDVTTDIQGVHRVVTTVMGAYSSIISDYDLMLQDITRMEDEVVDNQIVHVGIDVFNTGRVTVIDSAIFRWSINSVTQPKSYKWVPSSPLQFGEIEEILIDSFKISSYGQVDVVVWAEKINEGKDSLAFDDTVSKTAAIVPLARFASPLVADTIHALSFDVYVKIVEGSGALYVNPVPKMNIQTQMSNGNILYDTIDMVYNNGTGLWVAHIPQQYYGSKVIYSITVSDTVGNSIVLRDETYLKFVAGGEAYNDAHIAVTALQGLVELGTSCIPDYVAVAVILSNVGGTDYDFSINPIKLYMQVTQPEPFYLDTLVYGTLRTGEEMAVEVTNMFPTVVAGRYDIRVWIDSLSPIIYDDTLSIDYVSGKFSLPIDEDFSNGIPIVFASNGINSYNKWDTISQGTGADMAVLPQFGSNMLAFKGSQGSMTVLSTQQLDLSRTLQPSLSFWYFHDTIPCEDYTDVRITVDGGTTYNTLFSLSKYDAVYGWRQYNMNLPTYAVNQCVILVFEAMEKSRSGNVAQYIDRIRITARQDIAVTDILTSSLTPCTLQNRELKMVMTNLTDLALDFASTNTTLTIEVKETGQTYTHLLTSGSLGSFVSDTFTVATGVDFTKGTYTFKAYFSSVLDVDRQNDTLVSSIVINPAFTVQVERVSGGNTNCLAGESPVWQEVTITNTGNMDLQNIELILQIDTGNLNQAAYVTIKETCTDTLLIGKNITYRFNTPYSAPWHTTYYVGITAYLLCDSALANGRNEVVECVNTKDLYIVSIDNPSGASDAVGATVNVTATLHNRADNDFFSSSNTKPLSYRPV